MTLSLRQQRQQRLAKQRLSQLALRDLAAWGEYAAFCDAYRHGALSEHEYEACESGEWHRLIRSLVASKRERRGVVLEADLVSV